MCSEVRVARRQYGLWDNYVLYAGLAKNITPGIRSISVRESGKCGNEVFYVVKRLLKDARIRLHRFIVQRPPTSLADPSPAAWKTVLDTLSVKVTAGLLQSRLVSYCERVIVKDFVLTVSIVMESRIPSVVFAGGQVDKWEVVELLEKHVRSQGPPVDVQQIAHFMAHRGDSKAKARLVRTVLSQLSAF
ncbi:uncharacterized protein LOC129601825 [Paramacrobiotus metropolitanus]|uniref:uncharacterized protein LOC129601825 n=1 Tax=Paramacrobiotus metropolitanus TaxID=2943436 RepID=UPI002445D06E|nr:uncharacterized protein LOC129601825 [Paramacrobiotus metropolitanus]